MKRLFKKSAILFSALMLFLFSPLVIMVEAAEATSGDMSFDVRNAIGREGVPIQVTVEENLISDNQIEYCGRQYPVQDFIGFLVRNLLVGPRARNIMRVEFRRDLPAEYGPFDGISLMVVDGGTTCVLANDRTVAVMVCESIDGIGVMDVRRHALNLFM